MRTKGCEYDAAEADVSVLVALRRVVVIPDESPNDRQSYTTRELHAAAPSAATVRSRRRTAPASERLIADGSAHSSDDES